MTMLSLVVRSAARNRFRAVMTVIGGALALVAFVVLRTVVDAWGVGASYATQDRLTTRHRVSYGVPLPRRYADDIRAVPGVKAVTFCDWFGGRWAKDPNEFFPNLACADDAFGVFPEMVVEPAALARFRGDKSGAIVGEVLAKRLHWKVGDHVTLVGSIYSGDWDFTIDGTYSVAPGVPVDRSRFFFRWDYKNERAPERQKNEIGWIFTRVDGAGKSAAVAHAIDALFDDKDVQTATSSERTSNSELSGAVSAIFTVLDVASVIILVIMTLIFGNTIAMGVRERRAEFGVLGAIGFSAARIRFLVVAEACAVALLAGLSGVGLATLLVARGIGPMLEENMAQFFPIFRVGGSTAALGLALTVVLGALASLVPAIRIGRLPVTEAIRRVA